MPSTVEFTETHACIAVDGLSASAGDGAVAKQCLGALLKHGPKASTDGGSAAFKVRMGYDSDQPQPVTVEIDIHVSLASKIPLLADIQGLTHPGENKKKRKRVPFDPPCPIWGLVSLLLLMEEAVTPDQWFCNLESDPSLAAQTLHMIDFLDFREQKMKLIGWLHNLMDNLCLDTHAIHGNKCHFIQHPPPSERLCARMLHHTEMLTHVCELPDAICKSVFSPTGTCEAVESLVRAIELPEPLLATWLSFQAPEMDLCVPLTADEWIKVFGCLSVAPGVASVEKIALDRPVDLEHVRTEPLKPDFSDGSLWACLSNTSKNEMRINSNSWCLTLDCHPPDPRVDMLAECRSCNHGDAPLFAARAVPVAHAYRVIHALQQNQQRGYMCAATLGRVLSAFNTACMRMPVLRELDLGGTPIHARNLTALGCLFQTLAGSLEELSILNVSDWFDEFPKLMRDSYNADAKRLFFRCVGKLRKLKRLLLPVWQDFVWRDKETPEPLLGLQALEEIRVIQLLESQAGFFVGLQGKFRQVPIEIPSGSSGGSAHVTDESGGDGGESGGDGGLEAEQDGSLDLDSEGNGSLDLDEVLDNM